jgi:hypothetical protein
MSISDPATLTVNAVPKALNRISFDGNSSSYRLRSSTDEFTLNIRNTSYTRSSSKAGAPGKLVYRHNAEFVQTVYAVAPSTANTTRRAYVVIENEQGDTLADPTYVAAALLAFLTASSNANIAKMLNDES